MFTNKSIMLIYPKTQLMANSEELMTLILLEINDHCSIGTCAVVRDLVSLVDSIEGPHADVNLYGYSYG